MGEQFTAADVVIGADIRWGTMFKLVPERPEFSAYIARIAARPAAKRAEAKDSESGRGVRSSHRLASDRGEGACCPRKPIIGRWGCLLAGCAVSAVSLERRPLWPRTIPNCGVTPYRAVYAAGSTNLLARMAAQAWEQRLGKPFVVENRPGGQQIGVNAVAKAAPDGYTLLMATSSAMGVNPTLYKKIAYDPVKDFQPIGDDGAPAVHSRGQQQSAGEEPR